MSLSGEEGAFLSHLSVFLSWDLTMMLWGLLLVGRAYECSWGATWNRDAESVPSHPQRCQRPVPHVPTHIQLTNLEVFPNIRVQMIIHLQRVVSP